MGFSWCMKENIAHAAFYCKSGLAAADGTADSRRYQSPADTQGGTRKIIPYG
jgi:hypothetical protein